MQDFGRNTSSGYSQTHELSRVYEIRHSIGHEPYVGQISRALVGRNHLSFLYFQCRFHSHTIPLEYLDNHL